MIFSSYAWQHYFKKHFLKTCILGNFVRLYISIQRLGILCMYISSNETNYNNEKVIVAWRQTPLSPSIPKIWCPVLQLVWIIVLFGICRYILVCNQTTLRFKFSGTYCWNLSIFPVSLFSEATREFGVECGGEKKNLIACAV